MTFFKSPNCFGIVSDAITCILGEQSLGAIRAYVIKTYVEAWMEDQTNVFQEERYASIHYSNYD